MATIQVCDSRPPRPLGIKWAIGRKGTRKREREEAKREEGRKSSFISKVPDQIYSILVDSSFNTTSFAYYTVIQYAQRGSESSDKL